MAIYVPKQPKNRPPNKKYDHGVGREKSKLATKISLELEKQAKAKGFVPENVVQSLIFLDYAPIDAILKLREIYIAQDIDPDRALDLAKRQYLQFKDNAIYRKKLILARKKD